MLARALPRALASNSPASLSQVRGMATEKQLKMRIDATSNISKITSSMKMVSAAKLRGDQNRLDAGKPFAGWVENAFPGTQAVEDIDLSEFPQKNLFVVQTADKGLCGAVNSFISRGTRDIIRALEADGKSADLVIFGDKGRAQLRRLFENQIHHVNTEVELPINFNTCCALSQDVLKYTAGYDALHTVYNIFVSAVAYTPTVKSIELPADAAEEGELPAEGEEAFAEYEFEPELKSEVMTDMMEYALACQLYYGYLEGQASEQSSRVAAMENASKNANEMVETLTLQYNKARQARITTELIEIISGAVALED